MTVNSSALQAVEWCNPSTSCYGFCRSIAIIASGDGRQKVNGVCVCGAGVVITCPVVVWPVPIQPWLGLIFLSRVCVCVCVYVVMIGRYCPDCKNDENEVSTVLLAQSLFYPLRVRVTSICSFASPLFLLSVCMLETFCEQALSHEGAAVSINLNSCSACRL